MSKSTSVLAVAVLALGLLCAALFSGQQALSERLAELEKRPTSGPRAAPGPDAAVAALEAPPRQTPDSARTTLEPEPRRVAPPPAPSAPPSADSLSPALQAAVAKEVDRVMKERGGIFLDGPETTDPVALMEKELGLSPAQKLRIQEIWKRRDEALMAGASEALKDPAAHMKKLQEIESEADLAIKRELDFQQQQKYDTLKNDGKLQGGLVFRVNVVQKTEK